MKRYISLHVILSGLIIVTFLAGCQNKKSILLQDNLCKYPCWQNIQPGSSTGEETIQILSQLPFINSPPSVVPRKIDNAFSYTSWNFQNSILEDGGWVAFFKEKVAYIRFDVNNHIRVADLIGYYGKPELLSVISGMADSRWMRISWIYPTQGVLITYFDPSWKPKGNYVDIKPDLPVYDVYYFDPNLYDRLLETVFFSPAKPDVILKSIQPWSDYGLIPYTETEK
jgi:hypothetical protein